MKTQVDRLPFIDTSSDAYLDNPFPLLREARKQSWLAQTPQGPLVLGFDAVQAMFMDDRFHEGGPQIARACGLEGEAFDIRVGDMMFKDGDEHTGMRRLVARFFTPRAMAKYTDRFKELLERHLVSFETNGGGDFVKDVALPVPSMLFCEILGAPVSDSTFLADVTTSSLKTFLMDPSDAQEISGALHQLIAYLDDLAMQREAQPRDDFMSALVEARNAGDISQTTMLYLAMSIVEGSSDNTTNTLAIAMRTFAEHPEQWRRIADGTVNIVGAVEECLRFAPRVRAQAKICEAPTELMGVTFEPGEWIFQSLDAANHDPELFDEPDTFDVGRAVSKQLAFGTGRHTCLGAPLARMELAEALTMIARRWPTLQLAGEPQVVRDANIRGIDSLPMTTSFRGA